VRDPDGMRSALTLAFEQRNRQAAE
jgi:hypothetical protein